ncbi:MAG: metal ABC transporter substrate-binding protein [Syntrophotaleaceae bacterium]
MKCKSSFSVAALLSWFLLLVGLAMPGAVLAAPLKICATVVELGSLASSVGGDRVSVTVLAKGNEDAHYLDAKPSFIKLLSEADLFIQVGMELEEGWAPYLLQNSRNARVQPGEKGFLDASRVIAPMEVPSGTLDRSMGDVHPHGNPHYLTDPLNGLKVAALIRDRLAALDPAGREIYEGNYKTLQNRMGELMIGRELAGKYDFEKIALLFQYGKLSAFLKQQREENLLGGWLGTLQPFHGSPALTYHKSWPYFARRFGLSIIGQLEPRPGIPPSPSHLKRVIDKGRQAGVRVVLVEPWHPVKPAGMVADKIGAKVVRAAVSSTGRQSDYDYLAGVDGVVKAVAAGLGEAGK